jgi:hypothetical protein
MSKDAATRCPVCGDGTLVDIAFDALPPTDREPEQQPESRQLDTYSCGHKVVGAPLQTADADQLDVERRASDETAEPVPDADRS